MSSYINIEDFIRQAPVGLAVYGRVFDGEKHQTDLFVREEKKFLRKIPPNPRVELRSGLFEQDGIALVCVLLEIADDNDLRYETWWNYHAEGGADAFADMAAQEQLCINLYDANGRARRVGVRNRLKETFAGHIERIKDLPPWSMAAFDAAKEKLYARWPSVRELWRELAKKTQQ